MDPVAWNSDDSFHHKKSLGLWRQENHDVPEMHITIGKQWPDPAALPAQTECDSRRHGRRSAACFPSNWRESRTPGDERDDEQPNHQDGCQRSQKLNRCFLRFLVFAVRLFVFDFFFLSHFRAFSCVVIRLMRPGIVASYARAQFKAVPLASSPFASTGGRRRFSAASKPKKNGALAPVSVPAAAFGASV